MMKENFIKYFLKLVLQIQSRDNIVVIENTDTTI